MNRIVKWWVVSVGVATVELTLKHIKHPKRMCEYLLMNVALSDSWIALQQIQCDSFSPTQEDSSYKSPSPLFSSPLAQVLKPTWHNEQQEIKLWSALVCWADLLPRCSLIIQGPWNAALLGPLQILRLCLALVSAASQSFYLSRRGSECAHQHSRYCPCCYLHTHNTQTIEHRTFPWNTNQYIVTFLETKTSARLKAEKQEHSNSLPGLVRNNNL